MPAEQLKKYNPASGQVILENGIIVDTSERISDSPTLGEYEATAFAAFEDPEILELLALAENGEFLHLDIARKEDGAPFNWVAPVTVKKENNKTTLVLSYGGPK